MPPVLSQEFSKRHKQHIMKGILLLTLVLTLSVSISAQDFEGKILYKNFYTSKISGVSDQQLSDMLGSTQDYIIKEGDYKSTINGQMLQWMIFLSRENKIYIKMGNSDDIYWNDASINKDQVISAQINQSAIEILGYKCDELVLTCKTGVQKYYFNSKIHVNPKLFEKHAYGNWYEVIRRTSSLPLKMILETEQFTLESLASSITPMTVDSKTFNLPNGVQVVKSPY